jgi:hypothetical protein
MSCIYYHVIVIINKSSFDSVSGVRPGSYLVSFRSLLGLAQGETKTSIRMHNECNKVCIKVCNKNVISMYVINSM